MRSSKQNKHIMHNPIIKYKVYKVSDQADKTTKETYKDKTGTKFTKQCKI